MFDNFSWFFNFIIIRRIFIYSGIWYFINLCWIYFMDFKVCYQRMIRITCIRAHIALMNFCIIPIFFSWFVMYVHYFMLIIFFPPHYTYYFLPTTLYVLLSAYHFMFITFCSLFYACYFLLHVFTSYFLLIISAIYFSRGRCRRKE